MAQERSYACDSWLPFTSVFEKATKSGLLKVLQVHNQIRSLALTVVNISMITKLCINLVSTLSSAPALQNDRKAGIATLNITSRGAHRAVGLFLALEAEGGAAGAGDVHGLAAHLHPRLHSVLAPGRRAPRQLPVVLNKAAHPVCLVAAHVRLAHHLLHYALRHLRDNTQRGK